MAFRGMRNLKSVLTKLGGGNQSFATCTIPKMKTTSPTIDAARAHQHSNSHWINNLKKAEYAPIAIVGGMVLVAVAIATHTAKQQLVHSPTVHVNKKKRESMPEVENPDQTLASASKFVDKSFLRNLAHIQENKTTLHDSTHPNPFTRPRTIESLKTAGVEPSRH